MNLFKHNDKKDIWGIDGLSEDHLISFYSICLNYKAYIESLLKMKNDQLKLFAPGESSRVRENLSSQKLMCEQFIAEWDKVIAGGEPKALKN